MNYIKSPPYFKAAAPLEPVAPTTTAVSATPARPPLFQRAKEATEKVAYLVFFVLLHKIADFVATWAFHEFGIALLGLRAVFFASFSLVYAILALDMVIAFIPDFGTWLARLGKWLWRAILARSQRGSTAVESDGNT